MRSCEEFELLINLYLDNMLPSEEQQALLEHLEKCPACKARYQQLAIMTAALGQMDEPAPVELHDRILNYVEQHCEERPAEKKVVPFHKRGWYRALAGVAACAVIAVAAVRFAPSLDFAVQESATEAAAPGAIPTIGTNDASVMPSEKTNTAEPEYKPSNETVKAPSELVAPVAPPQDKVTPPESSSVMTNQLTGQMAEDLPPLRKENVNADNAYRVATVRKWLKVTGKREALPDWVDLHFVYEAELEGTVREYVEIAAWAEEYWVDQLTACGFVVEVLEDQEVVEDGEHMLLIFFWEE